MSRNATLTSNCLKITDYLYIPEDYHRESLAPLPSQVTRCPQIEEYGETSSGIVVPQASLVDEVSLTTELYGLFTNEIRGILK